MFKQIRMFGISTSSFPSPTNEPAGRGCMRCEEAKEGELGTP
jgi:hypothetical protein